MQKIYGIILTHWGLNWRAKSSQTRIFKFGHFAATIVFVLTELRVCSLGKIVVPDDFNQMAVPVRGAHRTLTQLTDTPIKTNWNQWNWDNILRDIIKRNSNHMRRKWSYAMLQVHVVLHDNSQWPNLDGLTEPLGPHLFGFATLVETCMKLKIIRSGEPRWRIVVRWAQAWVGPNATIERCRPTLVLDLTKQKPEKKDDLCLFSMNCFPCILPYQSN